MFRNMFVGLVVLLAGCLCAVDAANNAFNFEVARHVHDSLSAFFQPVTSPVQQIVRGFGGGFFGPSEHTNIPRLRRLLQTQLAAFPQLGAIGASFGDDFVVLAPGLVGTTENVTGTTCQGQAGPGQFCLNFAVPNERAEPVRALASITTSLPELGFCTQNTSTWCPISSPFGSVLAVVRTNPILTKSTTIGHAAGFVILSDLDAFLAETYGTEDSSRVVFVVEEETHLLVAASIVGVTTTTTNGQIQRVDATQSTNSVIRESSSFLFTHSFLDAELLFVHNGMYIQNTPYHDTGVNWHIIVVRPVEFIHDDIEIGSTTFVVLFVLSCLSIAVTLMLMGWVLRFHRMRLWKSAQPEVLMMILVSNLMCALCTFVLVGEPSDALCLAQQWMIPLSVTLSWSSFIAKLARVLISSSTKDLFKKTTKKVTAGHVFIGVSGVMLLQVIVLSVWTAQDRLRPTEVQETQLGVIVVHTHCRSSTNWGMYTCFAIVFVLVICGCVVASRSRNISGMLAESRSLMTITFHGSVVLAVLVFVGLFGNLDGKTFPVLVCVALDWFSASSQVALFAPRVYHQLTLGDLTTEQLKEHALHHLRLEKEKESQKRSLPNTPTELAAKAVYGGNPCSSNEAFDYMI